MKFLHSWRMVVTSFVALSALLVALCFQGIDLADEGFWLTNAKFALSKPESIFYSFSYYFSVLTTSIWGRYVSDTLLSYRILGSLVRIGTIFACICCLYRVIEPLSLSVGVILGTLLSCGSLCFLYGSSYTGFFYVLSIIAIVKGMEPFAMTMRTWRSAVWLAIGGFFMGASVYVRVPNITSIAFFLVPLAGLFFHRQLFLGNVLFCILSVCVGWVLGFAVLTAIVLVIGHMEYFCAMLEMLRGIAKSGHHSMGILIAAQLKYYVRALLWGGFSLISLLCCGKLLQCMQSKFRQSYSPVITGATHLLFTLCIVALCLRGSMSRVGSMMSVGLFLLAVVAEIFIFKQHANIKLIWFAGLILFGIAPLGSDCPVDANRYVLPFVMPLCVGALMKRNSLIGGERLVKCLIFALVISVSIYVWRGAARDEPDRTRLTCSVDVPEYCGMFTTSERARAIEDVVRNVRRLVADVETLLVFPHSQGLYACVDRPPFLECASSNLYDTNTWDAAIERAWARYRGRLPLVVEEKWATGYSAWPRVRIPYISKESPYYKKFAEFLQKNGYALVWENEDFKVWKVK